MEKYSKQGEVILGELKSRKDHPTAAMVHKSLNEKKHAIGIATVYRNLQKIADSGDAIRIKTKYGTDRFDGDTTPHVHLECIKCGKIYDISVDDKEKEELHTIIDELANKINAKVEDANIKINGICTNCK